MDAVEPSLEVFGHEQLPAGFLDLPNLLFGGGPFLAVGPDRQERGEHDGREGLAVHEDLLWR